MRLILGTVTLTIACSCQGIGQEWEIGALGGFGWNRNSTISNSTIANPPTSGEIGFPSRGTFGVTAAENPYHYWGGEIRWLYQWGGPQIESNGVKTSISGYSNLVTYDFVVYPVRSESGFRPYLAGGAGVKAYTGTGFRWDGQQPVARLAFLRTVTEAEPAISVGGGLKYRFARHALLRLDFRAYFTPTPDNVIRPIGFSQIRGWLFEFVPTVGISSVF
jgi:hypothetical protein